jgi:hypothetical protein
MSPSPIPHRYLVRFLLGLGTVLTVLAIFAVWIERQALDPDEWAQTSGNLLRNEQIQSALSQYLTDRLFKAVDVQAQLQHRLPPQAKPLAGPIAGGLREFATDASQRAFASPHVQAAWEDANRRALRLALNLIEGNGELVQAQGGEVSLQLRPLVANLAARVGVSADVAAKLPPNVAELRILKSDQIDTVRTIVKVVHGLALVLSLVALGCLALAIYLSRGRRQVTVLWCGIDLIVAGIAVFVIRKIAGDALVNSLASDTAKPAAHAAWSIGTGLLTSIATTVIVYGALFVIASWLASPTASGRWMRRELAPWLRDHPAWAYGLLIVVALIYFALAPTHGLRVLLTLVLLTAFALAGLTALRRQTTLEFPDARTGDTAVRLRTWFAGWRGRRAAPPASQSEVAEDRRLGQLERLARLREQGVLTEEELAAEKARVLDRS